MKPYEYPLDGWESGYNAYLNHCSEQDNPFEKGSESFDQWLKGWKFAKIEQLHRSDLNNYLYETESD